MQKRWNPGDRENVDFEVGGPVLEDLKPGLHYEKEKQETSAGRSPLQAERPEGRAEGVAGGANPQGDEAGLKPNAG